MNILIVILRTTFFYFFILLIFRIMGKREIGELSIQDLVVSLLIAEMASISIENYKDNMFLTIIPIILLLIFELSSGYLSLKNNKFRNILSGKPVLIINKGVINYKEMFRQRYTLDDLLLELRNNSIKSLKEVEYAVLENNGHLNIFKYNSLRKNSDNPFALILDGIIQEDTLKYINKDKKWLLDYIDSNGLILDDIFYAFLIHNKLYVINRDELEY